MINRAIYFQIFPLERVAGLYLRSETQNITHIYLQICMARNTILIYIGHYNHHVFKMF